MLQGGSDLILAYGGDLRKLRERAEHDPGHERELLKAFKGNGDSGVDIFFREAQIAWDELCPLADKRVLAAARRLELADDARAPVRCVDGRESFVRLTAGLLRVDLENTYRLVAA